MLSGIKQKAIVGKDGKIELSTTELPAGTVVEVIILVESPIEEDETTYLLKSEANKKHLLKAIENVDKGNLIYVDLDESKIQGQLLTDEMKAHAVEQYIYTNKKLLNPILAQVDTQTKKKYTNEGAFAFLRNKMLKDYF